LALQLKEKTVKASIIQRPAATAVTIAVAITLSACGGGGSDPAPTTTTTTSQTPSPVLKIPEDAQLPATTNVAPAAYSGEFAAVRAAAFARANEVRSSLGLGLLTQDSRLDGAAQYHSDSHVQSHTNQYDAKDTDVATRLKQFNYPWVTSMEILDFDYWRDGSNVINGHLNSVYHRMPLLSYRYAHIGIGHSSWMVREDEPRSMTTIELGRTATEKQGAPNTPYVVWPRDGSTVDMVNMTDEVPYPSPRTVVQSDMPYGYPASVNVDEDKKLEVTSFEMRDGAGNLVPAITLTYDQDKNLQKFSGKNWAFLVPENWLPQSSTYTVVFKGSSVYKGERTPINATWSFKTPNQGFTAYNCGTTLRQYLYEDHHLFNFDRSRHDVSWVKSFKMNCLGGGRIGPQWYPPACLSAIQSEDHVGMTANCRLYREEPWRYGRPLVD